MGFAARVGPGRALRVSGAAVMLSLCLTTLAAAGRFARAQWHELRHVAAILATALFLGLRPAHWRRTVRQVFAAQVLHIGVESLPFTLTLAVLVGISIVVQMQVWVGRVGQTRILGPLLVVVVARELGPLFANFVAIVRGGSAIATELGVMKIGGEVRALEAQGLDPFLVLVMPRVLGMAVSTFCLTVLFIATAFGSGYAFGRLIGLTHLDPGRFVDSLFTAVRPIDVFNILAKSVLPAMVTAAICATEGLGVTAALTEVPQAARRSLTRALLALFVVTAVISLLTYL
jgi:phospholipid/cholesterol/gamma-HCH transport system permease protein